jgi:hypothetical protein
MNHGFHHLFGNSQENLYQLGRLEAESFIRSFQSDYSPLFRHSFFTQIINQYIKQNNQTQNSSYALNIAAYAEGVGVDIEQVWLVHTFADLVNGLVKYKPNLLSLIPACSSLFHKKSQFKHLRILDALHLNSVAMEPKVYFFEEPQKLKFASISYAGHPLKFVSVMNEKGLSIALHSKRSNFFDIQGININHIIKEIITQCQDVSEIKKLIREMKSMTLWGLYAMDAKGDVLSLDINGQEIFTDKYSLNDTPLLYFNHLPVKQNDDIIQPYNFHEWCLLRTKTVKKYEKKFIGESPMKIFEHLENEKYSHPFITNSSVGWVEFCPQSLSLKYGNFDNSEIYEVSPFDTKTEGKNLNHMIKFEEKLLREAQFNYDRGHKDKAYHQIQIYLEKNHDPNVYFFFLVWQYLDESDLQFMQYLYQEILSLENKLLPYLEEHRILFLLRIEKILGHPISNLKEHLNHPSLIQTYNKELKLRPLALKILKKLIFPRLETWDIIYSY